VSRAIELVSLVLLHGRLSYLLDLPAIKFKFRILESYMPSFHPPSGTSRSPTFLKLPQRALTDTVAKKSSKVLYPLSYSLFTLSFSKSDRAAIQSVNLVMESLNVFLTGRLASNFLMSSAGSSPMRACRGILMLVCFRGRSTQLRGGILCCCFEGSRVRGGGDGDDFNRPSRTVTCQPGSRGIINWKTYADNAPGVNAGVLLLNFFQERGNFLCSLWRSTSPFGRSCQRGPFLLVWCPAGVPGDVCRLAHQTKSGMKTW